MTWKTVASGSSFDTLSVFEEDQFLKKGTKVRVEMDLKLPVGWIFDTAGVDHAIKPFIPEGMDLIDVYGEGKKGIIEMEADPVWLFPMLLFMSRHWIAIVIAGFALYVIVSFVRVLMQVSDFTGIPLWVLIGGVGLVATYLYLSVGRARRI